jgi:hypothetical protein
MRIFETVYSILYKNMPPSKSNTPFTILGIDPGFATTGFALITEKNKEMEVLDYGVITTSTKQEFSERLKYLHQALTKIMNNYTLPKTLKPR